MNAVEDDQQRLVIRGVSATFGGLRALDDVSLSLGPGEVLGVIGPNGAGKTTLFNIVCGFVRPTSGVITYRGRELTRHRPHNLSGLGIARTLQGVGLWRGLTVIENVMTGAQARLRAGFVSAVLGLWRSSREEADLHRKAMDLLGQLRVAEYADRYPPTLPYAVQKRVALARALFAEPTLLLLDEPASGLSSHEIDELHDLVLSLKGRMAIMLVEHRMDFVISTCDRLVVLNFGRVIASGSPEEVQADPEVTTAYLGEEVATAGARGHEESGRALD